MAFIEKHLLRIKGVVGHSCNVEVLSGGGVVIRVWAKKQDGQMLSYQREFTEVDLLNGNLIDKLDCFKYFAKKQFESANCEDCDWSSGATERGAAEDDARNHARETDHRTVVEGGWSVMFERRN